jgi:hypothetical protein
MGDAILRVVGASSLAKDRRVEPGEVLGVNVIGLIQSRSRTRHPGPSTTTPSSTIGAGASTAAFGA